MSLEYGVKSIAKLLVERDGLLSERALEIEDAIYSEIVNGPAGVLEILAKHNISEQEFMEILK